MFVFMGIKTAVRLIESPLFYKGKTKKAKAAEKVVLSKENFYRPKTYKLIKTNIYNEYETLEQVIYSTYKIGNN